MRAVGTTCLVGAALFTLAGCEKRTEPTKTTVTIEKKDDTRARDIEERRTYVTRVETELNDLSTRYDAIKAKAQQEGTEVKVETQQMMNELEVKMTAQRQKLANIRESDTWREMRSDWDAGWSDVRSSYERLESNLQTPGDQPGPG